MGPEHYNTLFKSLFGISMCVSVLIVILVYNWITLYLGNLSWSNKKEDGTLFNYHILFMLMGMCILYGKGIVMYRMQWARSKQLLKLTHAFLLLMSLILTILGLYAVFRAHDLHDPPVPKLYSLHSWIGLTTAIFFALQYVVGFVTYLFPGANLSRKKNLLPFHTLIGALIFAMALTAIQSGITEHIVYKEGKDYKFLPGSAVMGNLLGACVMIFGFIILFLTLFPFFKRNNEDPYSKMDLEYSMLPMKEEN